MDQVQKLEFVRDVLVAAGNELGDSNEVQVALQILETMIGEENGDSTEAEDSTTAESQDDVSTDEAVHADASDSVGDVELTEV